MTTVAALKHHIKGRWETGVTLGTRENPSDLSGHGPREQGRHGVEFYTTVKTAYTSA